MNVLALVAAASALLVTGCSAAPAADAVSEEIASPVPASPVPTSPVPTSLVSAGPKARIVLMSSLPLVHGDGVDLRGLIAGKADPHPLHEELKAAHELIVADSLDRDTLAKVDLVILVQPRALPPDALVALDDYVRAGGRLLLFTDPALDWPSARGFGDPLGPLRVSLASPLLRHWGIELVDPELGSVRLQPSGAVLVQPGRFVALPGKTGDAVCVVESQGYLARCRPGEGRAILVADADLLAPEMISQSAESGAANRRFTAMLMAELLRKDTS